MFSLDSIFIHRRSNDFSTDIHDINSYMRICFQFVNDLCCIGYRVGNILVKVESFQFFRTGNSEDGRTSFQDDLIIGVKIELDGRFVERPCKDLVVCIIHYPESRIRKIGKDHPEIQYHPEESRVCLYL